MVKFLILNQIRIVVFPIESLWKNSCLEFYQQTWYTSYYFQDIRESKWGPTPKMYHF
jgi:hypothetical protein